MSDLDELMSRDPLSLSDQDIDEIIAYQRKRRGLMESGKKPTKEKPSLSLEGIMAKIRGVAKPAPVVSTLKRRM